MKPNDVQKFFNDIRQEQKEIVHLTYMIKENEAMLLPAAIRYDKDKVQASPSDQMSEGVAKIADMQAVLSESIYRLQKKQIEAETMLRQLNDGRKREVMRWYYLTLIDNRVLTWREVAIRMNYYESYVKKLHRYALEELSKMGTK